MTIRHATADDVDALVALGQRMQAESPRFAKLAYNAQKVGTLLAGLIDGQHGFVLVAEDDQGQAVGGFVGFMMAHWASDDLMAQELAVFVRPDKRGGLMAARMVRMFAAWAKERGCKQTVLGISTGVRVEETAQLYRALGLKQFGYCFEV
jgi:GNAT superfamily N-acetyltransferase